MRRGASTAAALAPRPAGRPGGHLPEVPAQGTQPALPQRRGVGGGTGAVLDGSAHPIPAGPCGGAYAQVGATPASGGGVGRGERPCLGGTAGGEPVVQPPLGGSRHGRCASEERTATAEGSLGGGHRGHRAGEERVARTEGSRG